MLTEIAKCQVALERAGMEAGESVSSGRMIARQASCVTKARVKERDGETAIFVICTCRGYLKQLDAKPKHLPSWLGTSLYPWKIVC